MKKLKILALGLAAAGVFVSFLPAPRRALASVFEQAVGKINAALPTDAAGNTYAVLVGGSDGTSLRPVSMDASGRIAGAGFAGAPTAPRFCDKTANVTTLGATATVQQIAGVGSQNIYICGMVLNASTATAGTTIALSEGTGANCATGTATVGNLFAATPTAAPTAPNLVLAPGQAVRVTATAGDALCFTQGQAVNATALSGTIFYTQN